MVSANLPDGTDQVTIWWSSQGRTRKVSGAVKRSFTGEGAFLDLEAGFDVPTSYELECFSGGISIGRVSIGTTTLAWVGDENGCVIQQPLNPNLHAVVTNLQGSWPSITRSSLGEAVYTEGNSYPSLIGFGPRLAATDVAVNFGAASREVAAAVWATLGTEVAPQMPVWLIRSHHGFLPRVFFAHVPALTETDFDLFQDGTWSTFTANVTEIARPAPGLVISPLSYTDLDVSYESYDLRDAAYASYAEQDSDFSLAGAAG
jgi:hypothetical protein